GSGRIEYDGFRVSMSESRDRFVEAAEIVRLGLTQERFSYKGKFNQIPEMSIRPQPRRKNLTDRFYGAIVSPETGDIMAKQGMGMLVIPQKPWAEHKADYDHFVESCAKFGQAPKKPIVVAFVYCAETDREGEKGANTWMRNYADTALRHYEYDDPDHFRAVKGYEYRVEMLRTIQSTMDAAEFVAVFKYGGMPLEEAERSMRLFAREVLPHIQQGTSPMQQSAAAGR